MAGQRTIDFQFLAENCVDIICSIGTDHVIHYVSPSVMELLGWMPEEMIGKIFNSFVSFEDLAVLDEAETRSHSLGLDKVCVMLRLVKKDSSAVWISTNARVVREFSTREPQEYVLVMRDVTERKILEERLCALALTDGLTRLWNRRAFDQTLNIEWKRTVREGSQLSLLLVDIDHFKRLNDRYGHPAGDNCLCAAAIAIADTVRVTDIVSRYGGDEITVILPNTNRTGAANAAEKVRSAIQALRFSTNANPEVECSVTASIGTATASADIDGTAKMPECLLAAADKALYKAKNEGRNRVETTRLSHFTM
jgi:diguanylate cyclase (GGDEF)-like protein/PAS domain S-box-containing protein